MAAGIALVAGLGMAAPQAAAQTLTDTLIAAYRTSNLIGQNRAVLRAADEDVAQAVSALRPVVNFVARAEGVSAEQSLPSGPGTTRVENLTAQLALSAELTVFDFGRNRLAIGAAEAQVLATRAALVGVEQQVLFNAVAAFMDVRAAISRLELREANVRLIGQELQAARDRFEVGEITRTDVSIAEARLAGARSQVAAAQGDLAVAREAYRAATGDYPVRLAPPPALPALPASLEAAQGVARDRHPAIRRAQFEVTAADLNAERTAAIGRGTVSGTLNLSIDDDRRDRSSVGLSYSRPVYTGGRNPSLSRQAIAQRDAARSNLHQTAVEVIEQVGRSWSNIAVSRAQIQASASQIEAAQTAFEGISQEAELGARTTLDVLNAEQELLDARVGRVDAETARTLAVYGLLSSMGLLTVEHLDLGIPVYDPEAYYNAVRNAPLRSPQGEQLDRILQRMQP
ncbi:transporter [Rhodobaculum claviforme]|uniref:Transporter n=2 Tax=Rhodobaculum claviforme TaxID=1549854 RepID=A0A934TI19_9RHOB|nr:transporter [Rhodobaculum claviforme]